MLPEKRIWSRKKIDKEREMRQKLKSQGEVTAKLQNDRKQKKTYFAKFVKLAEEIIFFLPE